MSTKRYRTHVYTVPHDFAGGECLRYVIQEWRYDPRGECMDWVRLPETECITERGAIEKLKELLHRDHELNNYRRRYFTSAGREIR